MTAQEASAYADQIVNDLAGEQYRPLANQSVASIDRYFAKRFENGGERDDRPDN